MLRLSMRLPTPISFWLRKLPRHFLVALGVVALLFLLDVTRILDLRERGAYDLRLKLRPPERASQSIVLVGIDDASLQLIGTWPWRRKLHAELTTILKAAGAKAVFFDILFPEKSNYPEDDAAFAEAVRVAGNIILPFHFMPGNPPTLLFPLPNLKNSAQHLGYANTEPDSDGVVRSVVPFKTIDGVTYYHSAVATFLSVFSKAKDAQVWVDENLARFSDRRMLINYPGRIDVFQRVSAGEIFEKAKSADGQEFLKKVFNRNLVMFGDVSTGSSDISTTPVQPLMPGLAIQASILNMLKTGKWLTEVSKAANYGLVFILVWLVAYMGHRLRPQKAFFVTLVIMLLFVILNGLAFYYARTVFYLSTPLIAMTIVFVLSLFFKYMDVRIESDFLARELHMASKIQQSLLPGTELKMTELNAGFRCLFYEQVGGDLYDWMDLGNGRVALCLGDVSGKGVPAALYMSRALNELRHQVTTGANPGEILTALNAHLSQGETSGMFLTLFFIIIDSNAKKIYFSNGGHDPMVYYHASENRAELIDGAGGLPIGIMGGQSYETGEFSFKSGDVLLLTSDGIKEQKSPQGDQYGSERLKEAIRNCAHADDPGKMIDAVMADVLGFASGRAPHDDRTLVCVKIV